MSHISDMTIVKGHFAETTSVRGQKTVRGDERWSARDISTGRFMDVKAGYGSKVNVKAGEFITNSMAGAAGIIGGQAPAGYAAPPAELAPAVDEKAQRRARMKTITKLGMALHQETLAALAK